MTQAASRALELLEVIAGSNEPLGTMAIADRLGLDKSTTSRLLVYLTKCGFIERGDEGTKRYSVGHRTLALAAVAIGLSRRRAMRSPLADELRDRTGETVTLHNRDGDYRVCIGGAESREPIRRVVPFGERVLLTIGPASKVILAYLPEAEIERILQAYTDAETRQKILSQLEETRTRGALVTDSDRTPGIAAIAAPIFDMRGIIGSVTISAAREQWDAERTTELALEVLRTASKLSAALGGSAQA